MLSKNSNAPGRKYTMFWRALKMIQTMQLKLHVNVLLTLMWGNTRISRIMDSFTRFEAIFITGIVAASVSML